MGRVEQAPLRESNRVFSIKAVDGWNANWPVNRY